MFRFRMSLLSALAYASLLSTVTMQIALAQSVSTLPSIEVVGSRSTDAQADDDLEKARQDIVRRAGATAIVDARSYADGRAATTVDALAYAPGVLAQTRHGQEARLSIRGSGLQRGFLMRGIQLYQDGIPLNHTDGAGDFQSIDPIATRYVEIWRGANALEYGANGLGGAVNFVSPSGLTAPPAALRVQVGSFGQRQTHASLASRGHSVDGFLGLTRSEQDGWRNWSGYRTDRFSSNVGVYISDSFELRGFLTYVDSTLRMPGSLSRAAINAEEWPVSCDITSYELMIVMVAAGYGVGIGSRSHIEQSRNWGVVMRPLADGAYWIGTHLFRSERRDSLAIEHFVKRAQTVA